MVYCPAAWVVGGGRLTTPPAPTAMSLPLSCTWMGKSALLAICVSIPDSSAAETLLMLYAGPMLLTVHCPLKRSDIGPQPIFGGLQLGLTTFTVWCRSAALVKK